MAVLDFWFDYSCPYAYLGATQVAALAMVVAQDYRYSSVDAALVVSGRCARCAGLARNGIG